MLSYLPSVLPQCFLYTQGRPTPKYSKALTWVRDGNTVTYTDIFVAIGTNVDYYVELFNQSSKVNTQYRIVEKMCKHGVKFILAVLDKYTPELRIIKRILMTVENKHRLAQRLAIKYRDIYPSLYKKHVVNDTVWRDINDIIMYHPEEYTLCEYNCKSLSISLQTAIQGDIKLLTKLYNERCLELDIDIRAILEYRILGKMSCRFTSNAAVAFLMFKYGNSKSDAPLGTNAFVEIFETYGNIETDFDIVVNIFNLIDVRWLFAFSGQLKKSDPLHHWLFVLLVSTRHISSHNKFVLDDCTACKHFIANKL